MGRGNATYNMATEPNTCTSVRQQNSLQNNAQREPYLRGIQEFGAAAYIKDLKAGKLDAHVQLGRFVQYDQ